VRCSTRWVKVVARTSCDSPGLTKISRSKAHVERRLTDVLSGRPRLALWMTEADDVNSISCSVQMHFVIIFIFRLHRMHEMLTIVTDVRGVCLSVCLSVTWLKSAVIRCNLCQITFTLTTPFLDHVLLTTNYFSISNNVQRTWWWDINDKCVRIHKDNLYLLVTLVMGHKAPNTPRICRWTPLRAYTQYNWAHILSLLSSPRAEIMSYVRYCTSRLPSMLGFTRSRWRHNVRHVRCPGKSRSHA